MRKWLIRPSAVIPGKVCLMQRLGEGSVFVLVEYYSSIAKAMMRVQQEERAE